MKKLTFGLLIMFSTVLAGTVSLQAAENEGSPIYQQKLKSLADENKVVDFSQYKGKVLLIVNTASFCGATPQYKPLQKLNEKYSDKGLAVIGFPCNQFGKQEPGSASEIVQFCEKNYGVTFDMFAKVDVNGENQAPIYKYLTAFEGDPGKVKWNFEKFLVSKDGKIVARFRTRVKPDSEQVISAIEAELAK